MKRRIKFNVTALVSIVLLISGCDKSDADVATVPAAPAAVGPIDADGKFERMLEGIDDLIGKRSNFMQTEASVGCTYRFGGPIEKVLSVVDAFAKDAGFVPETALGAKTQALQAASPGAVIKFSRVYKHPNGDIVTMSQVEASAGNTSIVMLSIWLMSPTRMAHK